MNKCHKFVIKIKQAKGEMNGLKFNHLETQEYILKVHEDTAASRKDDKSAPNQNLSNTLI